MIGKDVIEKQPISVAEVKNTLQKMEEDQELTYEQKLAFDHAQKVTKLGPRKAKEIIAKLMEDFKISEDIATQIVDVQPKNSESLKSILAQNKINIDDDQIKKIIKFMDENV
ncbi:MAG: RNA polymerase Rpb4 family protein [archaeon]